MVIERADSHCPACLLKLVSCLREGSFPAQPAFVLPPLRDIWQCVEASWKELPKMTAGLFSCLRVQDHSDEMSWCAPLTTFLIPQSAGWEVSGNNFGIVGHRCGIHWHCLTPHSSQEKSNLLTPRNNYGLSKLAHNMDVSLFPGHSIPQLLLRAGEAGDKSQHILHELISNQDGLLSSIMNRLPLPKSSSITQLFASFS